MTGNEFIRKLKKLGKKNGVPVKILSRRGQGSHETRFYGPRFTMIIDRKKELKTGSLFGMLDQLGLSLSDL